MGRQAYLNKIALGRSAFEPSQNNSQSTVYIQLESPQQDLPVAYQDANPNSYIQLYDERGNPTNPRSRDYGRSLREAQNDVLAAIGVVERRRSPSEGLPGAYEEQLGLIEAEDTVGNAVALASTLTENLCTWWIGAIRERILTFRFNDAFPFTHIIASERRATGWSLIYTGFPSRLLATVSTQAIVYAAFVYRPIDRALYATHASLKTRQFFRRWKNVSKFCLRLSLEVLFYPLTYHASLQRLGLVPARPMLPHWKSFIPFSQSSPITPFSRHYSLTGSPVDCLKAILTSPLVFVCVQHFYERWVYAAIYEAVESSVIHPDNPDVLSPDDGAKSRANAILGLRQKSPALIRNAINKLLRLLGWAEALSGDESQRKQSLDSLQRPEVEDDQTIEVGGIQVSNIARLELPTSQQAVSPGANGIQPIEMSNEDVVIVPVSPLDEPLLPQPPPSPTASTVSQDDNDPRIRITSREGIVEMEVRLPPHILSSHTEIADAHSPVPHARDSPARYLSPGSETRAHHRVTQLSSEPSQMIGAICKAQIVGWTNLPLKLVTLHLVASHFLATRRSNDSIHGTLFPLAGMHELSWRSLGIQASRIALCGALELAIDLSLWGCQNAAITWIGRNGFGWGTL